MFSLGLIVCEIFAKNWFCGHLGGGTAHSAQGVGEGFVVRCFWHQDKTFSPKSRRYPQNARSDVFTAWTIIKISHYFIRKWLHMGITLENFLLAWILENNHFWVSEIEFVDIIAVSGSIFCMMFGVKSLEFVRVIFRSSTLLLCEK